MVANAVEWMVAAFFYTVGALIVVGGVSAMLLMFSMLMPPRDKRVKDVERMTK